MSTLIWVLIEVMVLFLFLYIRKRNKVFSIEMWYNYLFIGGSRRRVIPTVALSQLISLTGATKMSLRKFKGCSSSLVRTPYSSSFVAEYHTGSYKLTICKKELRKTFWCVPKVIYYA